MMKQDRRTKIAFKYFFPNFSPSYFFLIFPFLSEIAEVTSEADADLIVFSVWHDIPELGPRPEDFAVGRFQIMPPIDRIPGKTYLFWSGENVLPDMGLSDYVITHSYCSHPNHLRLPYWVAALRGSGLNEYDLARSQNNMVSPLGGRRDCNFLYSHKVSFREEFAMELMNYFEVVCPGASLHNAPEGVLPGFKAKSEFLSGFNFTIAFENSKDDGYTTEKLIEPLLSKTIPLYWGNDRIVEEINPACFIQVENFSSVRELAEYMKYLILNENEYEKIAKAPRFIKNELPDIVTLKYSKDFFIKIFAEIENSRTV